MKGEGGGETKSKKRRAFRCQNKKVVETNTPQGKREETKAKKEEEEEEARGEKRAGMRRIAV